MKPGMLQSQLETLEEPKDAVVCDVHQTPEAIVAQIRQNLGL
jgi:gluconokinase